MKTLFLTGIALLSGATLVFSQNHTQFMAGKSRPSTPTYRFSIATTYLSFANFGGSERTNTHHLEFHAGYSLSSKDKISLKVAKWELFAPMGIQLWDSAFLDESEFLPGKIGEKGIGLTYQRMLWKGLFATVEVLPLFKTYKDLDRNTIGHGFKLYTSYHLGYHVSLFKNRLFIEPQVHCNYWPIDTNIPEGFLERETKWKNYFLFEPNLYIGINLNKK